MLDLRRSHLPCLASLVLLIGAHAAPVENRPGPAPGASDSRAADRAPAASADRADDELVFAFWNVENLFDPIDDPDNPGDDEYLPANGWTPERYALKLDRLAEVIAAIEPHLLGVCEVENRRVLEDLVAHPRLAAFDYAVAHLDSPDKRGIDCACLFRAPFALDDVAAPVRIHEFEKEGEAPTRGAFEARLIANGQPLLFLVNHWPSRGGDRDGAFRQVAGARVRAVIDQEIADAASLGREPDVLVVGDLNDDPFDASVRSSLGAVRSRNAALNRREPRLLYNPSWRLLGEPDSGTLYYNRDWVWNVFDQAICSRGLLDDVGFRYVDDSFTAYAADAMRDQYRRPRRFRKNRDDSWEEGYSDHFPIHGRLRITTAAKR